MVQSVVLPGTRLATLQPLLTGAAPSVCCTETDLSSLLPVLLMLAGHLMLPAAQQEMVQLLNFQLAPRAIAAAGEKL